MPGSPSAAEGSDPERPLRVWIDLDNTPHATFFRPVVRALVEAGHRVDVTARADGRTVDLARLFGLNPRVVGGWRGRTLVTKTAATLWRAGRLTTFAAGRRIDVAVSHGSRPLILAARALRLPILTAYDYEGASIGLFHRLSDRVLLPRAVRDELPAALQGSNLVPYDGVKEQLYLFDFTPQPGVREQLGAGESDVLVLLRPEAETAHYHPVSRKPLVEAVLDRLATDGRVRVALLPRESGQAQVLGSLLDRHGIRWSVPDAIDGRDLVWAADLVISGGGTMTREAAILGVPAYSIFQGRPGAVDAELEAQGRLAVLRSEADARAIALERRASGQAAEPDIGADLLARVVDQICRLAGRGPFDR